MGLLFRPQAGFALAHEFQRSGAKLGELFAFASELYFRGKLAYARKFARPPPGVAGALVIAPGRGLLDAETTVTVADLRAMAEVPIELGDPRYREALERDARALAGQDCEVVLLGSVATGKYAEVLEAALGERLLFPADFVGRGDMSRGGLLLRAVAAGEELRYQKLRGAVRRGARPPKLGPFRKGGS